MTNNSPPLMTAPRFRVEVADSELSAGFDGFAGALAWVEARLAEDPSCRLRMVSPQHFTAKMARRLGGYTAVVLVSTEAPRRSRRWRPRRSGLPKTFAETDGRWVTYAQIEEARGISKPGAANLVRRNRWRREADYDADVVLVFAPLAAVGIAPLTNS